MLLARRRHQGSHRTLRQVCPGHHEAHHRTRPVDQVHKDRMGCMETGAGIDDLTHRLLSHRDYGRAPE